MKQFYAYVHARLDCSIFYVGKGHGERFRDFTSRNLHHQNIVRKHGKDNILIGRLDCSSEQVAFDLEKGLIKCLRRAGVRLVNLTDGGEGTSGLKHTKEHRKKNSDAQKVAQSRPEVIEKKRKALLGRTQTSESNLKRSETLKKIRNTKEYHDRHSAAIRGRPQTPEHVRKRMKSSELPVQCVETGQVFRSGVEAGRWCVEQGLTTSNFPNCSISRVILGRHKTAYGYRWQLFKD